jgi:hypothetical protein
MIFPFSLSFADLQLFLHDRNSLLALLAGDVALSHCRQPYVERALLVQDRLNLVLPCTFVQIDRQGGPAVSQVRPIPIPVLIGNVAAEQPIHQLR